MAIRERHLLNTYVIEGGIGKCTAFTALIPKLAKKAGEASAAKKTTSKGL